jgi:photosystem II stability/assembly factor-like uncharacterized protein
MLKKLLPVVCVILLSSQIYSQYWTEQVSGVTTDLKSVSVVNNADAWICGYSGVVLKTTNAGTNWINVSGNGIPNNASLINIYATDQNNALTAGYITTTTYVYRTTNGGTNWTQVFSQANGFINAMWMTSNTNGFMQGDPAGGRWTLFKTTNGGANWDSTGLYLPQAGTEAGWNNSLWYLNNKFWFGTNNTKVYFSSNNGASWSGKSTSPEVNGYSVCFSQFWTQNSGLLGGTTILASEDTGYTWLPATALGTGNIVGFTGYPYPVDNMYFQQIKYARGNKIYKSNGGSPPSFSEEYTAPSGTYNHMAMPTGFTGSFLSIAVRTAGGISKCTCPVTGISTISNEIPVEFKLKQNYPNPFNPVTNIEFSIAKSTYAKIAVYDNTGRQVDIIFSGETKPGTYKAVFDAGNYASGIYFYSLQTNEFTQTKKMILVK